MNKVFVAVCLAIFAAVQADVYSSSSGYLHQTDADNYGAGHSADVDSSASAGASANAADGAAGFAGAAGLGGYGNSQNIPYQPANTRGNSVSSSISYPNNKGEILIHRPAAIIVKRPPTKVVVNHPPLVVKPAPVVLHKPPAVVVRKVFVKYHPRPVKVEPVYVNVVKPPAEKYFVNEKEQPALPPAYAPVNVNADYAPIVGAAPSYSGPDPAVYASADSAGYARTGIETSDDNSGYQLLQNNQGLAALANLSGSGGYAHG